MKKAFLYISVLCLFVNCKEKNVEGKLEKFATTSIVKKILNLKKYKSYKNQEYILNDTLYKLMDDGKTYVEEIKKNKQNFKVYSHYDKKTLKIKRSGQLFITTPTGIHYFYNDVGRVVNKIDFDKDFDFSIEDFIQKTKAEFNIDLNNYPDTLDISIGRASKSFVYGLSFNINLDERRSIEISGKNGEILKDVILEREW